MNTETRVHEYHLRTSNRAYEQTAQEIYARGYNVGKSDAILEFVEMVKKDIGAFVSEDDKFINDLKVRLYKILDDRKDDVLKGQISKLLEDSIKEKEVLS